MPVTQTPSNKKKKGIQAESKYTQNVEKKIQQKKRPWASVNRKPPKEEVDIALIKTANSLVERATAQPVAVNNTNTKTKTLVCR